MPRTKPKADQTPPLPDRPLDFTTPYTPEEAAPYLRMTERQVRRRLDTGRLGCTCLANNRRFVTGGDILAYIAANAVEPLPEHLRPRLGDR